MTEFSSFIENILKEDRYDYENPLDQEWKCWSIKDDIIPTCIEISEKVSELNHVDWEGLLTHLETYGTTLCSPSYLSTVLNGYNLDEKDIEFIRSMLPEPSHYC